MWVDHLIWRCGLLENVFIEQYESRRRFGDENACGLCFFVTDGCVAKGFGRPEPSAALRRLCRSGGRMTDRMKKIDRTGGKMLYRLSLQAARQSLESGRCLLCRAGKKKQADRSDGGSAPRAKEPQALEPARSRLKSVCGQHWHAAFLIGPRVRRWRRQRRSPARKRAESARLRAAVRKSGQTGQQTAGCRRRPVQSRQAAYKPRSTKNDAENR